MRLNKMAASQTEWDALGCRCEMNRVAKTAIHEIHAICATSTRIGPKFVGGKPVRD